MPNPPLDELVDDVTLDLQVAFRRLIRLDGVTNAAPHELNSGAFQRYSQNASEDHGYPKRCMSLVHRGIAAAHPEAWEQWWAGFPGYGLAELTGADLHDLGYGVMLAPEDDQPWHAVAWFDGSGNAEKRARSTLADRAQIIVMPDERSTGG